MRYRVLILFTLTIFWISVHGNELKFSHIDNTRGLSHNQINCIFKDSKGFLWIGTLSGLNRFDGYTFKKFLHNASDSSTIPDNYILKINEDVKGNLWVKTRSGYCIYNAHSESFYNSYPLLSQLSTHFGALFITNTYTDRLKNFWIVDNNAGLFCFDNKNQLRQIASNNKLQLDGNVAIAGDSNNKLWIVSQHGILYCIDIISGTILSQNNWLNQLHGNEIIEYTLFVDNDNDLWIAAISDAKGLFFYDRKKNSFKKLSDNTEKGKLNTNIIRTINQANNGIIWVGTDHGGLNLIDKKTWKVEYLLSNAEDEKSISQNSITNLYKDKDGIMWIGTFKKGLNYYHENIFKFKWYKHSPKNNKSLNFDDVNCFAEDKKGNLWIGTNGGGLIYFNRTTQEFTNFKNNPLNNNSLSSNVIVGLLVDSNDKLWIGTYYGGLDCLDNGRFYHYFHESSVPGSISDNRVWEIFEDSRKNLWIGTLSGGLELFDRKKKEFYHYRAGEMNSVNSNCILEIDEDKEKNLWIGTAEGFDMFEYSSRRFLHFSNNPKDPNSLSNNNVTCLKVDSRDLIWVGTRDGLNIYNKKTKKIQIIRKENGLPDNSVVTILEDVIGNMWIGTPNGLCNLTISQKNNQSEFECKILVFNESDGLQGREFNEKAAFRTSQGEMVFGGPGGFNLFNPSDIEKNTKVPDIVFTDLQVFNTSVKPLDKSVGRILINQSITETKDIKLKYWENVFSVEFAALSFFHPDKCKYLYKLEGFDKEWLEATASQRKATYTNLDPGKYKLVVKASNNDGIWNKNGITLNIIVKPPFYKTWYAYVLYFLSFIAALLLYRAYVLDKERLNNRIEQERLEAKRRQDLDMLKIKFFTNISHEFRTPLTLIITPIDKILKNVLDDEQKRQMLLIQRNARRLLNLVNELLEFRKIEVQETVLNTTSADSINFLRDIYASFSDISEKKNIQFNFKTSIDVLNAFFDYEKLERIIFNLLSNAFKFTPESGSVEIAVSEQSSAGVNLNLVSLPSDRWLEIKISDTGIGIPADKHEIVFERFFQFDNSGSVLNQGSGIGLSIVKEFVKLHNGFITLQSEPNKGSCFTILLPIIVTKEEMPEVVVKDFVLTAEMNEKDEQFVDEDAKNKVLIIEDNEDFRFYLKDNLGKLYKISEAANGKAGLKSAQTDCPDLIVSDITMPLMDGIEMCRKLKSDQRTSHIPIILLTARANEEQKIEGFDAGADDYIIKPFSYEILEARIKNLIMQRTISQRNFQKQIEIKPSDITITSLDEKLLQKAIELVEKNISNPDFSVEELSKELGMSRAHLYNKLVALTGKSPIEFIRLLRLKRAAQLLLKSQLSVSEVAFQVGFNNPRYFSNYFKSEFDILPSEYAANANLEK